MKVWKNINDVHFIKESEIRSLLICYLLERRKIKEVVEVSLPQSSYSTSLADSTCPCSDVDNENECHQEDDSHNTMVASVSAHTKRKQKRWDALRSDAYRAMVQANGLPPNQKCFSCDGGDAKIRCKQCGPLCIVQQLLH